MIARFNYTGRAKLRRESIDLTVRPGPPRSFDAAWDFSGHVFPAEARVYVEATSTGSPTVQRFAFGTVGEPAPPTDRALTEVSGDRVVFSVKVVDESEEVGRILGLAEGLLGTVAGDPDDDAGRRPLLPVNFRDLGERVWRIEFRPEAPWLEVNDLIPGARQLVRDDKKFAALVFSAAATRVLHHVVFTLRRTAIEHDDGSGYDLWLRAAARWAGEPPPEVDAADDANRPELEAWVESAVDGFCRGKGFRDLFTEALDEEED